ncbi:MAG: polysaccharide pyruvyl transferase family protein [Roseimicrobium sp.]
MKLAFVGASGYGNTGDDTYPLVLQQHLAEHELLFYNSDLPASLPEDLSAVIIGCGGLIHNAGSTPLSAPSHHVQCLSHYLKWAKERGIPWGFVSCGVQIRPEHEGVVSEVLAPWIPWLKGAKFITMRSPDCVHVIEALTGRSDVRFFPDLGYLFRPSVPPSAPEPVATFIIGGAVNPRDMFCKHLFKLFGSVHHRIVWLSMGAGVDDDGYIADVHRAYPAHGVIASPTPEEAYRQVAASRFVVTGRYHGMVFARSRGVPFFVPEDSPWKIRRENFDADMLAASGHIKALCEALEG